jgi:hypothetical protein
MPTPDIINQLRKVLTKEIQVHRDHGYFGFMRSEYDQFDIIGTKINLRLYKNNIIISNGMMQYLCEYTIKSVILMLRTVCKFDINYNKMRYINNINSYEFLYTLSKEKWFSTDKTDSASGAKKYSNAVFNLILDLCAIDINELINEVEPIEGSYTIKYKELKLKFNRNSDTRTANSVYIDKQDNARTTLNKIKKIFNELNTSNLKSCMYNIMVNDLIYTKCSEFLENL